MRDDVRVFVLDYLRDGSADLDECAGLRGILAIRANRSLGRCEGIGVTRGIRRLSDGRILVFRPANLHAIWWARRAPAHHYGSAA